MRRKSYACLLAAALLLLVSTVRAALVTSGIPMKDVTVKTGDRGNYYVIVLSPPAEVTDQALDRVFLEFVVDVSASAGNEAMPCSIGVFPLTEQFTGANPSYEPDVPSVRFVPAGEDRKITADITDVVKAWLANPSTNHGLVIGALTGPEVGRLVLNDGVLGPHAAVRVTFLCRDPANSE